MKTFLDRLLPEMQPYMIRSKNGDTMHPARYRQADEQGFAVFCARGFPEVLQNFDGVTSLFRCLESHSENRYLCGEFLLPAAELINQPIYSERKNQITNACMLQIRCSDC